MNNQRKLIAGVALAMGLFVICAVAWFIQSPTAALAEIKVSAQKGDVATLNRRVDFPALRGSVKSLLVDAAGSQPVAKGRFGGALARIAAGAMAGPVVDVMVTPEAIALMFQGVLPARRNPVAAPVADSAPPSQAQFTMTREWNGLSNVHVRLRSTDSASAGLAFVMVREGLSWRLVGVER